MNSRETKPTLQTQKANQTAKSQREAIRDIYTVLTSAVMVLVAKVFGITDPEVIGAMTAIILVGLHRKAT